MKTLLLAFVAAAFLAAANLPAFAHGGHDKPYDDAEHFRYHREMQEGEQGQDRLNDAGAVAAAVVNSL